MATWKDGPRYAPQERPYGFAVPRWAVSLAPEPVLQPPALAPPVAPDDFQMQAPAVPLDSIVPIHSTQRNPSEPFASHSAVLTASDVGSLGTPVTRGDRSPEQPFSVASIPTSGPTTWAPPPDSAQPVVVKRQVAIRDVVNAAYPPLLIAMVVVGIVGSIETFIPMGTLVIAPFFLVPRVRFRVSQLRKINFAIIGVLVLLWVISIIMDLTVYNADLGMNWWILLGCWGLAVADVILQWMGLRYGETPNTTH